MGQPVSIDLVARVFHTGVRPGSVQLIRLFQTRYQMRRVFRQALIKHEFDCSFVHVESQHHVSVLWKNKAGPITFCGSGAYAVAGVLLRLFRLRRVTIKGSQHRYTARREGDQMWLYMPPRRMALLQEAEDARLFYDSKDGILIVEFKKMAQVMDTLVIRQHMTRLDVELHGVCAFSFDRQRRHGAVRYFVPWHGRDEDYVTGSIHQWLTPLVYRNHKVCRQTWTQLSRSGGRLVSRVTKHHVAILGAFELMPSPPPSN